MALVNHSISNLIQGVSQQSEAVRLENQLEEQVNCFADVTKGLVLRNGLELSNIIDTDLENSNIIEFNLDGEKVVLSLDPSNNVEPVKFIPMTADIQTLTTNLTDTGNYFHGMQKGDLKVLEDKDKVYLLNTKAIVAELSRNTAVVNVKVLLGESGQGASDAQWDSGYYRLEIYSSLGNGYQGIIYHDTTVQTISTNINSNPITTDALGRCYVTGTPDDYRVTFYELPDDDMEVQVIVTELQPMVRHYQAYTWGSERYSTHIDYVREIEKSRRNQYFWNGELVGTTNNTTTSIVDPDTGEEYGRRAMATFGWQWGTDGGRYPEPILYRDFRISRKELTDLEQGYLPIGTTSDQLESLTPKQATRAMFWVSGCTLHQTFTGKITYSLENSAVTTTVQLETYNASSSGAITVNGAASALAGYVNGAGPFTTQVVDNAVMVTANAGYVIDELEMTNNFDTSSVTGIPEAALKNNQGLDDITTIPPNFVDGFKLRIGGDDSKDASYYLQYSKAFRGWKETGLDDTRSLMPSSMPYIIDKEEVRRTGQINIKPEEWASCESGDFTSNASPTIASKKITDMFFYGSRLGFATESTIVMSAINKTNTFYRTTNSKIITSDRVDIKLDSSKVGFDTIKSVTTLDQKLFINSGSTQSVLLVNNSFDLSKARLTEVSSYTLGDAEPLPVENGLYFPVSSNGNTNVMNYVSLGENVFEATDITKHCPTYIEGTSDRIVYGKDMAILTTEENRKTIYVQNRFAQGGQVLQNAWHRWELPYDVKYIYYSKDTFYFLLTTSLDIIEEEEVVGQEEKLLVCKFDTKPQVINEVNDDSLLINWTPFLDIYTKDKSLIEDFPDFVGINTLSGTSYSNVEEAYDSTKVIQTSVGELEAELYSPSYKWFSVGDMNTIHHPTTGVLNFGNVGAITFDHDGFRYFKGTDQGNGDFAIYRAPITTLEFYTSDMLYGLRFKGTITLSKILPKTGGEKGTIMTYATLILRRMRLFLAKTGPFGVTIDFAGRKDFVIQSNLASVGSMFVGTDKARDGNYNFPINGKSDLVSITINTESSTPFNLLAAEWQGQLITRGRSI